jgi:hypothetical protein
MQGTTGYNDETIETPIGYLDPRTIPGGVMFSAVIDSIGNIAGQDVTFQYTITNIGNGFNKDSGKFKVPVDGVYEFSFSTYDNSPFNVYIHVRKNGADLFTVRSSDAANQYNSFGYTWQLSLNKNDIINLYVTNQILANISHPFSFIGKLVSE